MKIKFYEKIFLEDSSVIFKVVLVKEFKFNNQVGHSFRTVFVSQLPDHVMGKEVEFKNGKLVIKGGK